jgi:HSP20 family protein
MSKPPVQRRSRSLLPGLSELFTGFSPFAGFPAFAGLRPIFDGRLMRLEDEMKDGRYELRVELPGIDPVNDVEITVRDGQLTIEAERADKNGSNGRSEFTYGSFTRSVALPAGADEDDITATYSKGILTISVPISESGPTEKHVQVQSTDTDDDYEFAETDDEDESPETDGEPTETGDDDESNETDVDVEPTETEVQGRPTD